MIQILTVLIVEPDGPIGHDTGALGAPNFRTEIGFRTLTEHTRRFTTLRRITRNHVIADLDRRHPRPDTFYNTSRLVA